MMISIVDFVIIVIANTLEFVDRYCVASRRVYIIMASTESSMMRYRLLNWRSSVRSSELEVDFQSAWDDLKRTGRMMQPRTIWQAVVDRRNHIHWTWDLFLLVWNSRNEYSDAMRHALRARSGMDRRLSYVTLDPTRMEPDEVPVDVFRIQFGEALTDANRLHAYIRIVSGYAIAFTNVQFTDSVIRVLDRMHSDRSYQNRRLELWELCRLFGAKVHLQMQTRYLVSKYIVPMNVVSLQLFEPEDLPGDWNSDGWETLLKSVKRVEFKTLDRHARDWKELLQHMSSLEDLELDDQSLTLLPFVKHVFATLRHVSIPSLYQALMIDRKDWMDVWEGNSIVSLHLPLFMPWALDPFHGIQRLGLYKYMFIGDFEKSSELSSLVASPWGDASGVSKPVYSWNEERDFVLVQSWLSKQPLECLENVSWMSKLWDYQLTKFLRVLDPKRLTLLRMDARLLMDAGVALVWWRFLAKCSNLNIAILSSDMLAYRDDPQIRNVLSREFLLDKLHTLCIEKPTNGMMLPDVVAHLPNLQYLRCSLDVLAGMNWTWVSHMSELRALTLESTRFQLSNKLTELFHAALSLPKLMHWYLEIDDRYDFSTEYVVHPEDLASEHVLALQALIKHRGGTFEMIQSTKDSLPIRLPL